MKHILLIKTITTWLLISFLGLLSISLLLNGKLVLAILIVGMIIFLLPSLRKYILQRTIIRPWSIRIVGITILIMLYTLVEPLYEPRSIYRSTESEEKLMAMYNKKMQQWPVPFETLNVDTRYGKVHVIVSGPKGAPDLILLHAGAIPSWSWRNNIEGLSQHFRTYAIDYIGGVGKSELANMDHYTRTGEDIARLYVEICNELDITRAFVLGASNGGFAGTNLMLHAPERVKKLALLGPMGVTPATKKAVTKMILLELYPFEFYKKHYTKWTLGDHPVVRNETEQWFNEIMGQHSREVLPTTFSPEELQSASVPVLLVLGQNDKLVGDPEKVKLLAGNIPDLKLKVLDTGHVMWIEEPILVNELIFNFFSEP